MRNLFLLLLCSFFINVQLINAQCIPDEYTTRDLFLSFAGGNCGLGDETNSDHYSLHRDAILTDQADIHIPVIPASIIYTDPDDDGDTKVYSVYTTFYYNNDPSQLGGVLPISTGDLVSVNLSPGLNLFTVDVYLSRNGHVKFTESKLIKLWFHVNDSSTNDFGESFSYSAPDEIWTLTTAPFTPPCSNAYSTDPDNGLYKYSQTSAGSATAYIKYGEGNSMLTRPIIFVEGIDFEETTVLDPVTGEVLRHGSNGWENVIQGLSESIPVVGIDGNPVPQEFLFRNYPQLIDDLLSDQSPLPNYDIVLLDFKDGADYIQKNGNLLIELIERVNQEKACGYENVVLGLSMGGLVARYALTTMEENGSDHDTRTYISFDSPHLGANIPLSLQAFVWFNATFTDWGTDNSSIKESWRGLNKPAAHQMLYETFLRGHYEGRLDLSVQDVYPEFLEQDLDEDDFVDVDVSLYIDDLDYGCLRDAFMVEMADLGFPKETYNVAIANGSGNGTDNNIDDGECILDVDIDYTGAFLQTLGNNVANVQFRLEMTGMTGKDYNDDILFFRAPFTNQQKLMQINVKNVAQDYYPPYDGLPGCLRGDIGQSVVPVFVELGEGPLPDAQVIFDCVKTSTTFMPTSSVVAYETSDYNSNMAAQFSINPDNSPFDAAYFPSQGKNEPHVDGNIDNFNFLDVQHDMNLPDQPSVLPTILPSNTLSKKYNFGLSYKKIPSCEINDQGIMYINRELHTSYVDAIPPYLKGEAKKSTFETTIMGIGCDPIGAVVNINTGGRFIIGDDYLNDISKRGVVYIADGSILNNNSGGRLDAYVGSEIIVEKGGTLNLNGNSTTVLESAAKVIVRDGGLLIVRADASLELKGKAKVIIEKGGRIEIEQNNTLILNDYGQIDDEDGSKVIVSGELHVVGDELTAFGAGSIVLDNTQSITSTEKSVTFTRNGDLNFELLQILREVTVDDLNLFFDGAKVRSEGLLVHSNSFRFRVENSLFEGGNFEFLNITNIDHENSEFIGVEGLIYNGTNLFKSRLAHYKRGTQINFVNVNACTFSGDEFTESQNYSALENYIQFSNIGIFAFFKDCLFTPHDGDFTVSEGSIFPKTMTAISILPTVDPAFLFFNNTVIKHFEYGIYSPVPELGSTIFLANQTTLEDNTIGIYMNGNRNTGLVDINCSNLINNKFGVQGNDVLLNIDAILHAGSSGGVIKPNKFIRDFSPGGGWAMFDICYKEKEVQERIPANGNYWRTWFGEGFDLMKYDIFQSSNEYLCDNSEEILLEVTNETKDEPFGCPVGLWDPTCDDQTFFQSNPEISEYFVSSPDHDVLSAFYDDFCYEDLCNGSGNIHVNYWAGYTCLRNLEFHSAYNYFYPIANAVYTEIDLPIFCHQQALVANHVANNFQGSEGPPNEEINFTIETDCSPNDKDIFFVVDASTSVSSAEYNLMTQSIKNTLKNLDIGTNRFAVANFANTYDLVVPITSDLGDTSNITRTLSGGTNVGNAFENMNDYILSLNSNNDNHIILYTDAEYYQFNAPPYDIYNDVKSSPISAEVFVVRYQTGNAANDALANAKAAAIASKGGSWNGDVDENLDDPEGSGGPRKLLAESFSGEIPGLATDILNCDTLTVVIPTNCTPTDIVWTASEGGEIIGDFEGVLTIVTNGVGEYSVTLSCGPCTYSTSMNSSSDNIMITQAPSGLRYRYGNVVKPISFENPVLEARTIEEDVVKISPNPFVNKFEISNIKDNSTLDLFDVNGKLIFSEKNNDSSRISLSTDDIPSGIYFLKVSHENLSESQLFKVVKI